MKELYGVCQLKEESAGGGRLPNCSLNKNYQYCVRYRNDNNVYSVNFDQDNGVMTNGWVGTNTCPLKLFLDYFDIIISHEPISVIPFNTLLIALLDKLNIN